MYDSDNSDAGSEGEGTCSDAKTGIDTVRRTAERFPWSEGIH